jgi:hypothetical protein
LKQGTPMRKIEIIEIENSFINFFTPAVLVPASYFLFNLIGWPWLFLRYSIAQSGIEIDLNMVQIVTSFIFMGLTCLILYYILIYLPRLKVHDAEYKKPSRSSFYEVGVFLCILLLINGIIIAIYEFFYGNLDLHLQSLLPIDVIEENPFYFLAFLIYDIVLFSLFNEIVFRRALIPTLEDRGSSPFLAVLLAALGSSFIDLPAYFLNPNYPYDVYKFIMMIIFGICAGLIYISTRNIIFPLLLSVLYSTYRSLGFFVNSTTSRIYDILNLFLPLIGILILIYIFYYLAVKKKTPRLIRILKIRSNPKILKGIIGFLGITLGLLAIQTIVAKIGRIIFNTEINGPFPEYFSYILIFYAIAFSIPFFLTTSTQWAKHPTN